MGLEETWITAFDPANGLVDTDPKLDLQCVMNQFDYCVQYVNNAARPKWKSNVVDVMTSIYNGSVDIDTGLDNIENLINTATAANLAG